MVTAATYRGTVFYALLPDDFRELFRVVRLAAVLAADTEEI